jgi:hypothetical protein
MATAIGNCPQLRSLEVFYVGSGPLPTLSNLFAKIPTNNPLRLEHLSMTFIDATIDQITLPHLTNLTSFKFRVKDEDASIAQSVWTSFMVNNIKLSDVEIGGSIIEEAIAYLSSFSGLKRLAVPQGITTRNLENTFFAEVLPNHVNSLEILDVWKVNIIGWVRQFCCIFCVNFPLMRSH